MQGAAPPSPARVQVDSENVARKARRSAVALPRLTDAEGIDNGA